MAEQQESGRPVAADTVGPLPRFMRLAEPNGVDWVITPTGAGMWLVGDYRLGRQVLTDPRFSRAAAVRADVPKGSYVDPSPTALTSLDGSEHTRLRRVVAGTFTARRVAQMEPSVQALTDELLDDLEKEGSPGDVVAALAAPLPLAVLCQLLGIAKEDHEVFRSWVDLLFDVTTDEPEVLRDRRLGLVLYMSRLIRQKRREAGDDLLSALVHAHDVEGRLSHGELVNLGLAMLTAGYETTVGQISLAVLELLTDPGAVGALRQRPDLVPAAVEELLRVSPSTPVSFPRVATEDVRLADVTVEAGQAVLVSLFAGNRDPRVFACPAAVDVNRQPAHHLTFGHGVHRCLGASLARLEMTVALTALIKRFPGLRLADGGQSRVWKDGLVTRGLSSLWVAW